MTNSELCIKYGIRIEVVGDVYSETQDGSPVPPHELNMFMVGTPAGLFDEATVEAIPLAATAEDAEALAVKCLNLQ